MPPVQVNSEVAGVYGSAPGAEQTPIDSTGTFVIKHGPGVFYGLVGLDPGSSWTVSILDSAGRVGEVGQRLFHGRAPRATGEEGSGGQAAPPFGVGVKFYSGLTVITSGTNAGSFLVCWK